MRDDDDYRETPPVVVAAVSIGTAPLPFLAVYAVLFILHGWVRPVHPPDITSTQTGELIAGIVAAVVFVMLSLTLGWFLNARRRWPFALGQLAVIVAAGYLLLDPTSSGKVISGALVVTAVIALVLGFAPDSWRHLRARVPGPIEWMYGPFRRSRASAGDQSALPRSSEPSMPEPASLRRRRASS